MTDGEPGRQHLGIVLLLSVPHVCLDDLARSQTQRTRLGSRFLAVVNVDASTPGQIKGASVSVSVMGAILPPYPYVVTPP
jgi:hypothetical protein